MWRYFFYFTTQRTGLLPLLHKGPGGFSRPEYRLAMLSSLPGASRLPRQAALMHAKNFMTSRRPFWPLAGALPFVQQWYFLFCTGCGEKARTGACPHICVAPAFARGSALAQKQAAHPCACAGPAARNRMLFARGACSPAGRGSAKGKAREATDSQALLCVSRAGQGPCGPCRAAVTAR